MAGVRTCVFEGVDQQPGERDYTDQLLKKTYAARANRTSSFGWTKRRAEDTAANQSKQEHGSNQRGQQVPVEEEGQTGPQYGKQQIRNGQKRAGQNQQVGLPERDLRPPGGLTGWRCCIPSSHAANNRESNQSTNRKIHVQFRRERIENCSGSRVLQPGCTASLPPN